mgnify:CR=1 FL=1
MTQTKHKVLFRSYRDLPEGYFTGTTTHLVNDQHIRRGSEEEATLLTKLQAKRLIDSCRHANIPCEAIPSFTITY